MSSSVITVAGVKYAAGLYWQPSAEARRIAKAAREAAKQPGFQADFYCIREPTKSQPIGQFGLGIASAGHKEGMPSIAACLVGQRMGSWAGAFRVPEGVYFIAVREDLIDPDGDALFTEENEAQARLEQEITRGGLIDIIAPPEWGVHKSQASPLPSILGGRKDITLKRVGINWKILIQLLVVCILGGIGYGVYDYMQEQAAKEAAQQQAQELAMEKAQKLRKAAKEYPRLWQDAPHPMDVVYACQKATGAALPRYLGWQLDGIDCSSDLGLKLLWHRAAGGGNAIIPMDGNATLDPTFTTAAINIPLDKLPPRGTETLAYYGMLDQFFMQQNLPVTLVSMPDDILPPSPDKDVPPPPPPTWRKRKITFNVKGAPWFHPELFDTIPGLIITDVKSQGGLNAFTVEGVIYENKQP